MWSYGKPVELRFHGVRQRTMRAIETLVRDVWETFRNGELCQDGRRHAASNAGVLGSQWMLPHHILIYVN
jgi:hypothetical protein